MIPQHHQVVFEALAASGLPRWRWTIFETSSVKEPFNSPVAHYSCHIEGFFEDQYRGSRSAVYGTGAISVWAKSWSEAVRLTIQRASEYEAHVAYDPYAEWEAPGRTYSDVRSAPEAFPRDDFRRGDPGHPDNEMGM